MYRVLFLTGLCQVMYVRVWERERASERARDRVIEGGIKERMWKVERGGERDIEKRIETELLI